MTSLEALALPSTPPMLASARALLSHLAQPDRADSKSYAAHASEQQLIERPEIILWGLEPRLLDLVENYVGLPVSYRGLTFRRDLVDGKNVETRLWHRDDEDHRIVKVIVYLNDVTPEGGPFEYIPRRSTPPLDALKYTSGRILDHDMESAVPSSQWKSCVGSSGTVVVVDTCSVFHRGKLPTANDRFTMFFCYNSRRPKQPQYCGPLFSKDVLLSRATGLSRRQRDAMMG